MVDHELLVHISTSATRQNDQLFRSLADAYLDFEPRRSHGDNPSQEQHGASSQSTGIGRVIEDAVSEGGNSFQGNLNTSILSISKDSYGSFPSGLSSDKHYDDADAEEDEFPPASSRLARLERIHQNWKAQVTPKSSAASKRRSTKDAPSSEGDEEVETAFIEDTQAAAQAIQSQMTDSFETEFEDTDEDEAGEHVENGALEVSWEQTELEECMTIAAEEALQVELEGSSPRDRESSSVDDLDAGNVAQGVSSPSAESAQCSTAPSAEKPTLTPAASLPKVTTASVIRRKSTRLEEARGAAQVKMSALLEPHPGFSGGIPAQQSTFHSNDTSKAALPFKVPTAVTNRRKSTRLQEAGTPNPTPPPPSTPVLEFGSPIPGLQEPPRLPSPAQPNAESHATALSPSILSQRTSFTNLPSSVLAPEPTIGISSPPTLPSQITPYLSSLLTQHPTLFQPFRKHYSPAPNTRGWWAVDCREWSEERQMRFWEQVCVRLGDGRLGWATSLHREIGVNEGLGVVRLFCWGELVEHMWLVLWVCSERGVEGRGCRWVEAGGRVVFEMR